jgi:two-component system phosphate regulon sensor histidine kinase PhoR
VLVGIRFKLFLLSLSLILFSVAVSDVFLTRELEASLTRRIESDMQIRLALVVRAVETAPARFEPAQDDPLADSLGHQAAARVTIVGKDGRVSGDSEVELSAIAKVENHADRPEITGATASGRASATRESATTGTKTLYMAAPFRAPAGDGVVRIGVPLTSVDQAIGGLHRMLAIATGLATLVAIAMSATAAHLATGPMRRLIESARRMAEGDLATRTNTRGTDEFDRLGRALDQLAGSFSTALGELKEERDLLQGILEGMQEGVLLLDAEGKAVMVNPSLRAMLLIGADATGKTVLELVRHAELKQLLDRARTAEGPTLGEVELAGIKPRRLLVRAAAQHGDAPGLLAVFVDVTDVRRLESLRRDFVSNASHELRTPVSSILSAAETLRDVALQDPAASPRFVDIIVRNAERLKRLVDDLLDLSRIESREFQLSPEPADVPATVAHVLSLFRERADKKRIRLVAEAPAELPQGTFDKKALEAVLSNLVDNAVKYCPEGSSVTVRATPGEGTLLRIAVEDTGPGIEAKHLPRLFERFYRVDAGRSREVGGTGLGLSIVKHLIEAMGGTIKVESTVGRGTAFRFTLPRAPSEPDAKLGGRARTKEALRRAI